MVIGEGDGWGCILDENGDGGDGGLCDGEEKDPPPPPGGEASLEFGWDKS
jgi:hypothetical protein